MILFVCLFVVPGDPLAAVVGEGHRLDPATRAALARRYHLDRPLPQQYMYYIARLGHGDLGESYRQRRPVNDILREKLPNTAKLAVAAVACEIVIGTSAGVAAAVARRSYLDVLVTVATTLALGLPIFVIGLGLQHVFAFRLRWLPVQGQRAGLRSIVLPALTLGIVQAAVMARLVRTSMLEVLDADYIRTATAKGLPRRAVVTKHALRNSIIPVLTYVGIGFGTLLGGAAIAETIFNWDGLGRAIVTAIAVQDNPVVLGVITYSVGMFVLVNFMVDLAYVLLDPRIRLSQ
jgi:oligopeptide transport system permease protein